MPGGQGGPRRYLGDTEPGLPPGLSCLALPFLFCLQNKETQPLHGSASDSSKSSCLPLLLAATIHPPSSRSCCGPVHPGSPLRRLSPLLEALDCSPSFPVFLASPQALSLPDGQLLTILPLPAISRGGSGCRATGLINHCGKARAWDGTKGGEPIQRRSARVLGVQSLRIHSFSPGSAERLCRVRGPYDGVRAWLCGKRLHVKQVGVRLELLNSG